MKKFIIGIKENEKFGGIVKRVFPTEETAKGYIQCLNDYKKILNLDNCIFDIVELKEE